jgi:hypothetical protein
MVGRSPWLLGPICQSLVRNVRGCELIRSISRSISRNLLFRILLPLWILGLAVWAQDASTGALRGSVLDAQGMVVTNADIVAICVETGVRYHTATDVAGTVCGGSAAAGKLLGARGGGRDVAADFSGDECGSGSGAAVDVQADGGGSEGDGDGVGGSSDGGYESNGRFGAAR